jgi:hypothetical protein
LKLGTTLRSTLPPPRFRPPQLMLVGGGNSMLVDLDLTSIDADEYLTGHNSGLGGDVGEDLRTEDLFGSMDGDDDLIRMATPCSNASLVTMTPMPPQGPGQRTRMTSTTRTKGHNPKTRA